MTGACIHSRLSDSALTHPADVFESAPGPNAVGAGWGGTADDDEDPWGAFEDPALPPVPIPVTELTANTPTRTPIATRPARIAALSPSSSPRATPLASPAPSESAALPNALSPSPPVSSKAGMTKEEKAAEMARRKEERKQVGPSVLLFVCVCQAHEEHFLII
jgi:SCY1-like protein 1